MTEEFKQRFLSARRHYIAGQFANLNDMQREAVLTTEKPLLLLAGAGSGKTTVLIHRIANLIRFGRGSDSDEIPDTVTEEDVLFLEQLCDPVSDFDRRLADSLCAVEPADPWSIIAITFTNKAANELKERLADQLGPEAMDIWAMTFHSACCRILRREIERLGYTRSFTIYDSDDSERVMKNIIKDMGLDDKTFPPRYVLSIISREKDKLVSPEELLDRAENLGDMKMLPIAKAYQRYQRQLKENNAVDFDDIILLTVRLLQEHEDVRAYYQRKFRYVLVDEYQDTNHLQYLLTSLLAGRYENICVVGDDDQSIYRFRGATIENILSFEKQYRGARVIRLEQNYRSTQFILNAANAVIAHNLGRKGKRLWTANDAGQPVTVYEAADEGAEASFVAGQIMKRSRGKNFRDYAILYRTNAQSNALEYAMKRNGIPYRVIGGTRFFDRAEVKDMLAYLCVIHNRADDLRLKRIINNPPRGLGAKSVETADRLAQAEGMPLYSVISDPFSYGPLEKPAQKFLQFTALIEGLAGLLDDGMSLPDFYEEVMLRTGYVDMLQAKDTEENRGRLENIRELKSSIHAYMENEPQPTLAGFLEEIALYTDIEQYNEGDDAVVMMTMHASKGLEFPHVFLVGFEDGLFPGMRAIGDREEMEEERRLCYVAITRAKENLTISHARQRMLYGRTSAAIASRFLRELPENEIERKGGYVAPQQRSSPFGFEGSYAQYGRGADDFPTYRKAVPKTALSSTATATPKAAYLDLNKGDMVQHAAFGKGLVLSVMKMGGDALLEIAFDEIGTKKLMAKTASVHMKKL
ncbi:MAG: UvrD-helicase domain-containing protein [Oscillospiraceae bacterium]|nr:UvrD-helicase domain-containing protein [Oscillospiraceae bacterium]